MLFAADTRAFFVLFFLLLLNVMLANLEPTRQASQK